MDVWLDLEDGRTVDPNDCAPDGDGVLRHKSGVAVAMRAPGVPRSRGVDAEQERAKAAAESAEADRRSKPSGGRGKAMKPDEEEGGYKTRETKAE